MESEPNRQRDESGAIELDFRSSQFLQKVADVEQALNRPMTDQQERRLLDESIESIGDSFGYEYYNELVNVGGYAYLADEDGDLTGEESIFMEDDVMFSGLTIVKPLTKYEVVFCFNELFEDDNLVSRVKTIYIPPTEMLFLTSMTDIAYDSTQLKYELEQSALRSEDIIQSDAYRTAPSHEQRELLISIAQECATSVIQTYNSDVVEIDATEFYLVKNGSTDDMVVSHIDQTSMPLRQRQPLIGRVDGCSFIELIHTPKNSRYSTPERQYPSIVLTDDENDILYVIPIRAFNFADVVQSSGE